MSFVLDAVARPSLILMTAAVLSKLLRRSSASVRHAIWILAIAGAVLVPVAVLVLPQFEWSVLPGMSSRVTFLRMEDLDATQPQTQLESNLVETTTRFQPEFVWVLGMAYVLLRLLAAASTVQRMAKSAILIADDEWRILVTELSNAFHIRRNVRLLLGRQSISPMTWGVWRNTILLPSTAANWTDERRRLVLTHELAHVKRNDGLIHILIQIVCSIYWFNPLIWYAAHRARIERERACDDRVLSLGAPAADYADHLVQVVRGLSVHENLSFASLSIAHPSQLESRVISILDSSARRGSVSKTGTVLLCAVAGLLTASIGAIGVATAVPLPPVFVFATKFMPPAPAAPVHGAATPQRTRVGNGNTVPNSAVIPPQVLESPAPSYTQEAVEANVEGVVTLEGFVDIKGNVSRIRVLRGLGYGLDQKAVDAVLGWKFKPALRNGARVEAVTQIEVDFKIPPSIRPQPKDDPPIRVGPGVMPPTIIFRVEPEYTQEAREAKYEGTLVARVTVHKDGTLTVDEIVRELDYGLTQRAIEALEQWKFKSGMRNGEPVAVSLTVEVNFNLK
jgi:TonB family protein